MSWIVAGVTAGVAVIGGIGKGITAMGQAGDVERGKRAALDIYNQKLGLLGDVKTQAVTSAYEQAGLGYDVAQSQFAGGQRDVTMGTQMGMRNIQAGAATAASRSGLATSGTIEQQTKIQTGDLMAKYKSDMTKLFETRQIAGQERDLSINKATLSYRQGEMSAEDAYQNTLTDIAAQPTGFLEGMFS